MLKQFIFPQQNAPLLHQNHSTSFLWEINILLHKPWQSLTKYKITNSHDSFFPRITGANYWTPELPFPSQDKRPTKPQQSTTDSSWQDNLGTPKPEPSTKWGHRREAAHSHARCSGSPGSGKHWQEPTSHRGCWLPEWNLLPTPSHFLPSQKRRGGFSETPQPEPEKRPSSNPPPRAEVGEPGAHSLWKSRMPSSGRRAQPRPPAAPLGCILTALQKFAHLVFGSR